MSYIKQFEIRWADLDPNFHVLHSKYYDFGAYCRMSFLVEHGLTPAVMIQHHIGPIIFREECTFRREIKFGDKAAINLQLVKLKKDASRWSMYHEIIINENTLAAVIQLDGAWMDVKNRKLCAPPAFFAEAFDKIPKSEKFEWI